MAILYFFVPLLSFLPFYCLSSLVLLILIKKNPEKRFYYKYVYLSIPILLIILALILAFFTDLVYSIYGGSFTPSTLLLFWMFIKLNLDGDLIYFFLLGSLTFYLLRSRSLSSKHKLLIIEFFSGIITVFIFFSSLFDSPDSIAFTEAYLKYILFFVGELLILVFITGTIFIVYKLFGVFLEQRLKNLIIENTEFRMTEDQQFDVLIGIKLLLSFFVSAGFLVFLRTVYGFFDSGLALIIGGIYGFIPIILTIVIYLSTISGYKYFRKKKLINQLNMVVNISFIVLILIIPFIMLGNTTQTINRSEEALYNVNIATNPLQEYPVVLDEIRLVDRDLAKDIADNLKLPEPPKSFRVEVLDQYEEIGIVNGAPSWIVPIRYHQVIGNPDTNLIAGYIAVNLSSPIPEDSVVKYVEMKVGPGLDGYRSLEWIVREYFPQFLMGNSYLVDPWKETGKPAWAIILDKYSPWGLRQSHSLLIVRADGSYELLTRDEAINKGLYMINSDYAIMSIINQGTEFLRGRSVDPSARGYLFLPSSPDVQEPIEKGSPNQREGNPYYYNAHHFLMANQIVGRDRYMMVKTGAKESIVVWTAVNKTLTYYDFRSYSKGGISGINSPDAVFGNIRQIAYESGLSNLAVRFPKLYKIENLVSNNTLLIWVSIVVQQQSGADRFAGMSFVDAANPRFSKFLSAQLGEQPAIFINRFKEAINQTYAGFIGVNDTIGGQTSIISLDNVTVLRNDWVLLQPDDTYARILYIQTGTEKLFFIVTENSVGAKDDFYTALLVKPGDKVHIEARWDSGIQGWLVTRFYIQSN